MNILICLFFISGFMLLASRQAAAEAHSSHGKKDPHEQENRNGLSSGTKASLHAKCKPGEVTELCAVPKINRVKLCWDIHEKDEGKVDHFEIFARFHNERHFWRVGGFPENIRGVEVHAESLATLTYRVQIVFKDGYISNGKTVDATILHKNVVFDKCEGRDMQIYLPDGYYEEDRIYPVIYMHDGQNLFSERLAFVEDWRVDDVIAELSRENKMEKVVVVGIYNSSKRAEEYTPFADREFGGGKAREFSQFVVEKIIPYIEGNYRVSNRREDRAVMGSSFGGILSLWMGYYYPEVFSMVAAISPSLWIADGYALTALENEPRKDIKIWIDQGTGEWSDFTRNAVNILLKKGYQYGKDLVYYEVKGAHHNEVFWADRLDCPYIFFKGKPQGNLVKMEVHLQAIRQFSVGPVHYLVNPVGFFENGMRYSLYANATYTVEGMGMDRPLLEEIVRESKRQKAADKSSHGKSGQEVEVSLDVDVEEAESEEFLEDDEFNALAEKSVGPFIDKTGLFEFRGARLVKIIVRYDDITESILVENPDWVPPKPGLKSGRKKKAGKGETEKTDREENEERPSHVGKEGPPEEKHKHHHRRYRAVHQEKKGH